MNKRIALLLITMIATSSLIMIESASAQSIHKPSVPEFTVQYVDNSYDVPPTTTSSTDPYTNKTTTTTVPGRHVENKTVQATVRNNIGASYYNFRYKGHFSEEWRYYPFSSIPYFLPNAYSVPYQASTSSYTEAALPPYLFQSIPAGGQVDVQVQALFGDFRAIPYGSLGAMLPTYDFYFEGTTSDWSNTQTIIIGGSQTPMPPPPTTIPTPTPNPTPIPVPGQSFFFVESNSTVTELFFNSTSSELSFTVNGTSGTAGYMKVTIAKSLVSSVQNVKVHLDGNQLNVAITEEADSWLLNFNYMHSTHHVKINLATHAATTTVLGMEYWMWIGVLIVFFVIGMGLSVYFKKRKRQTEIQVQQH